MKKLILVSLILVSLALPRDTYAQEVTEEILCPQPYGGAVVCGVKTHEPVEAGLAENLGVAGLVALGASGYFLHLSKKARLNI